MKQNGMNSTFESPGYVPVKLKDRYGWKGQKRGQRIRIVKGTGNKGNRRNYTLGYATNPRARANFVIGRKGFNASRRKPINSGFHKFNNRGPQHKNGTRGRIILRRTGNNRSNRRQGWSRRQNVNGKQKKLTKEGLDMDLDRYMGNDDTIKFKLDRELDDYFNKES